MEIGRLSSLGGELDKRQHVGAMSGSFAPLPDGDPNFLCRSVAHSIQQNWSLGVDRCTRRTHVSPTLSRPRAERCAAPISALAMCSMDTDVREVAAGPIPTRPAPVSYTPFASLLFAESLTQPYARSWRPLLSDPFHVAMAAAFTMWPNKTKAKVCGTTKAHSCSRLR
jgi:hypothetical protein